jgi:hypothetical protein
MEIVTLVHDLAIVLMFTGVALLPRAVMTYLAVRDEEAREQLD